MFKTAPSLLFSGRCSHNCRFPLYAVLRKELLPYVFPFNVLVKFMSFNAQFCSFVSRLLLQDGKSYNKNINRLISQLKLVFDQFVVVAAFSDKFWVRSMLNDTPVIQHKDVVGVFHG